MILQSILEWQHHKGDWCMKNADFSTLVGCHGNVPWEIKKAQCGEQTLRFWRGIRFWATGARIELNWARFNVPPNTGARKSTIKKTKKRKSTGRIYSPDGKFAERAKISVTVYPFWQIAHNIISISGSLDRALRQPTNTELKGSIPMYTDTNLMLGERAAPQ